MAKELGIDEAYWAQLQEAVERERERESLAAYPISQAMMGLWAEALMDDNPVYADADAGRATGRPGVIAPPTMIQAWTMPRLSRAAHAYADVPGFEPYRRHQGGPRPVPGETGGEVYKLLTERGFVNSAATNSRQFYHREAAPGDHIRCVSAINDVSAEKRTAMGKGHFVTTQMDYFDQADRAVATQHWRVLWFRTPTEAEVAEARDRRVPPKVAEASAYVDDDAAGPLLGAPAIGQRTQRKVIPITPTFVIATALATNDYNAIHHDVDWARGVGRPGIFNNILTTTGLVGGVVTRWAGPATRLRSIDLALLTPNYPGDELILQGRVTAVDGPNITLAVRGINRTGVHVESTVTATIFAH